MSWLSRAWNNLTPAGRMVGGGSGFWDDLSGKSGADAAREAAAIQAKAGREASQLYDPYTEAGQTSLEDLMGGNFEESPGYQFRLEQGNKAISNAAGVGGSPYSGATLKALTGFGQNMASQEYGNWWDRKFNMAGMGLDATGGKGNALMGIGNAQAGGVVGAANAGAQGTQNKMNIAAMIAAMFSDERLKTDIAALDGGESLALLQALEPVSFAWKEDGKASAGVIAQQLREHAPHLVHEGENGFLTVDYGALVGHMIAAFQQMAKPANPGPECAIQYEEQPNGA